MGNEATTFASLVQRTWRENVLFSVLVELTYRCNLDCVFCYNDLGLGGTPLSTERMAPLLRRPRGRCRCLNLTLSGGEPWPIPISSASARAARDLGFVVRVKSNGHALGGRSRAAPAARRSIPTWWRSASTARAAATHDRQTRVPGSFDRLTSSRARAWSRLGLRVRINATLTRWNEEEVEGMFALADDLGVRLQVDPEVTPRDDGDRTP